MSEKPASAKTFVAATPDPPAPMTATLAAIGARVRLACERELECWFGTWMKQGGKDKISLTLHTKILIFVKKKKVIKKN